MLKNILFFTSLILLVTIPTAYAEVVTDITEDYITIEDTVTGVAQYSSHQKIMVDDEWKDYSLLVEDGEDGKVIFNSNSVGSFIYDNNSCSYSIWGNGYNGEQILPSVSSLAIYKVNGEWEHLPINDELCDVHIRDYNNEVTITSTKSLTYEVSDDHFIPFNGTQTELNDLMNTDSFTLVEFNNDLLNLTNVTKGYYDYDNPIITRIVDKYIQKIVLNPITGFKETFSIFHNGEEELGITQTINSGSEIVIGNQVIDIESLNGMSFDKTYLEDNQAQIFEIAENLNYDFSTGFQSLSNVNIIYDGDYKVNIDYSSGIDGEPFIKVLEIDPTIGATGSDYHDITPLHNHIISSGTHNGTPLSSGELTTLQANIDNFDQYYNHNSGSGLRVLIVGYTVSTVPQPPTALTLTAGVPVDIDYTPPIDDGDSLLGNYKIYRTQDSNIQVELPNSSGSDSQITFSDNELLIHGMVDGAITDDSTNSISITKNAGTFTQGILKSGIQDPDLTFSSSVIPDNTDSFTVGSWVSLDSSTNTKLLGINDVTFSVGSTSASVTSSSTSSSSVTDNFSSSSGWQTRGSQASITGGVVDVNYGATDDNSVVYKSLGTDVDGDFVLKYKHDWQYSFGQSSTSGLVGLSDGSGEIVNPTTSNYAIAIGINNDSSNYNSFTLFTTENGVTTNHGDPPISTGRTLGYFGSGVSMPDPAYVKMERVNDLITIYVYSDSGYSQFVTSAYGSVGANFPSLDTIQMGMSWTKSGRSGHYSFDDLDLSYSSTSTNTIISATGLTDNTSSPQHYSFTRSGNDFTIYQNGASVATATDSTSLGTNVGQNYSTKISGMIDEYFISSVDHGITIVDQIYDRGGTTLSPIISNEAYSGSSPEYQDSGVSAGQSYLYSMKSTNSNGDSNFLTPFVSVVAGVPPNPPTGITATIPNTATAPLDVTVSFSPSATTGTGTVTGFQLLRDGVAVATDGLVTSIDDTAPAGGTTYAYTVKALGTHGNSVASSSSSVTTPNTPAQVTGLTVTPVSTSRIDLSWNTPSDNNSLISGYKVQISSNGGSSYTDVLTGNVNTAYQALSLNGNAQYHFKVSAINGVGTGTASDVKNTYTMTTTPASLSATPVSEVQINLSWGASTGASGYKIEYESPTGDGFTTLVNNTGTVGTTYSASGLTTATQYNFKVSGWNNGGTSVASPEASSYTWGILQAPVLDTITRLSPTSLKLDFTAGTGLPVATGYKIERQTGSGWIELIADTGNTDVTYTDYVLSSDQSATYRLYAINSIGTSPVSNELTSDAVASSGGGGGSSSKAVSSQTGSTGLIDLTFIDQIHRVVLGQFLSKSINVAWDSSDNLEVKSIIVSDSPFRIVFQDVPFVLIGDQSGISNGKINYSVQIPSELCTQQGQLNCVEQKQYEVPVEIQSVHKGSTLTKSSVIKIDLAGGSDIPLVFVLLAIGAVPVAFILRKVGSGKSRRKASGSSHKSSKNGSNSKKMSL